MCCLLLDLGLPMWVWVISPCLFLASSLLQTLALPHRRTSYTTFVTSWSALKNSFSPSIIVFSTDTTSPLPYRVLILGAWRVISHLSLSKCSVSTDALAPNSWWKIWYIEIISFSRIPKTWLQNFFLFATFTRYIICLLNVKNKLHVKMSLLLSHPLFQQTKHNRNGFSNRVIKRTHKKYMNWERPFFDVG